MSNVLKGGEFASAVGRHLCELGLVVQPEYAVDVGLNSRFTKKHRFDFGSPEVLIECKCFGWTAGGHNPSAKISTLNEAMMYFHSTPGSYRKMLFLPKIFKANARIPETFAQYYVRLHGHFVPSDVEIWELDGKRQCACRLTFALTRRSNGQSCRFTLLQTTQKLRHSNFAAEQRR